MEEMDLGEDFYRWKFNAADLAIELDVISLAEFRRMNHPQAAEDRRKSERDLNAAETRFVQWVCAHRDELRADDSLGTIAAGEKP